MVSCLDRDHPFLFFNSQKVPGECDSALLLVGVARVELEELGEEYEN
jgi:hypothetical protein